MTNTEKRKSILVGISGGLKSLVAAFLLKKQGYDITAVCVSFWDDSKFLPLKAPAYAVSDVAFSKSLMDSMGIPFYAVDARAMFSERILGELVVARISGQVFPEENLFNQLLLEILEEKRSLLGIELISTGHLARINLAHLTKSYHIYTSLDHAHDQSHLLAYLPQENLSRLILPLSDLGLKEVTSLCEKYNFKFLKNEGLPTSLNADVGNVITYIEKNSPKSLRKHGTVYHQGKDIYYSDHEGFHLFRPGERDLHSRQNYKEIDRDCFVSEMDYSNGAVKLSVMNIVKDNFCFLSNVRFLIGTFSFPLTVVFKNIYDDQIYHAKLFFKGTDCALIIFDKVVPNLFIGAAAVIYDRDDRFSKIVAVGSIFKTGEYVIQDRLKDYRSDDQKRYRELIGLYEKTFNF